MPRSKTPTVSLEAAKARFEAWRLNRKGKAAIPDELWATAVEVARKERVSRTSTELRVEWNHLKLPECTIELEGRRGKLRIQLRNTSVSYLAKLSRELLESAS